MPGIIKIMYVNKIHKNVTADLRSDIDRGDRRLRRYISQKTIVYNTIKTITDNVEAATTNKNNMAIQIEGDSNCFMQGK